MVAPALRLSKISGGRRFLSSDWSSLVKKAELIAQPVEMVPPGNRSPVVEWKSLLIVTLAHHMDFAAPRIVTLTNPLCEVGVGQGLWLDAPQPSLSIEARAILEAVLPWGGRLASQCRSPGSNRDLGGVRLHIVFQEGAITNMELEMLIRRTRADCHTRGALIARDDILADTTSLLVEFSDPQVLRRYLHLCNEVAFVSDKSALIRTEVMSEVWEHELADEFSKDQESVVTGVRWRQSRLGGKFWATPPLSGQQTRAARRERQRRRAALGLAN